MSDPRSENSNLPDVSDVPGQDGLSDDSLQSVHAQMLREKPEPKDGFSPIPILLLLIFSGLIVFGGIYMARYSAGFNALAFNETVRPDDVGEGGEGEAPPAPDPLVVGKRLYTQNCVACHQATGQGLPGVFPPLVASEWVLGSEQSPIRVVLHGLGGEIEVLGVSYNSIMPAFGPSTLNWGDGDIAAVLSYIRQEWGNAADPVSPETVAAVRAETADRTTAWTAAELDAFK
ncbi:MAG: cytochrome C [Verrucomicrobia bacterium]|nr:MAG: cytochrome C [Verrucomicrobiota bacterium]